MAYIPKTDEEEQLLNQQKPGQPMTVPGTSAGGEPGTPGGIPGVPTPAAQPNQAGNMPFTDINAYLDANKEQGAGLAGQIGTNLAGEGKAAQDAADTADSTFRGQVDAGAYVPSAEEIRGAVANPTKYIKDTAKAGKFTNAAGGKYNGPANLEALPEYQTAQAKTTKAVSDFKLPQSEQGQRQILSGMEKNPTGGQTSFDQLILGQNPNAMQTIKTATDPYATVNDYLAGKATAGKTYTDTAKANVLQGKTDIGNAIKAGRSAITGQIGSDLSAKQAALTGLYNADTSFLNDVPGMRMGDANNSGELGLSDGDISSLQELNTGEGIYGLDPNLGQYLRKNVNPDTINASNVTTPEQIAKYNALGQLGGIVGDSGMTSNPLSGNAGAFDKGKASTDMNAAINTEGRTVLDKYNFQNQEVGAGTPHLDALKTPEDWGRMKGMLTAQNHVDPADMDKLMYAIYGKQYLPFRSTATIDETRVNTPIDQATGQGNPNIETPPAFQPTGESGIHPATTPGMTPEQAAAAQAELERQQREAAAAMNQMRF